MSASLTAYNIVVSLKNQGVSSPYLDAFYRFGADGSGKKLLRALPPQLHLKLMELLFVPGMPAHFAARKKLIREQTEKAIAEGIRQIVVVGAGFDVLALTLAEKHPDCVFIEMDLPNTQQQKRNALMRAQIAPCKNAIFHPCDLSRSDFTTELTKVSQFTSAQPALFIFEGVLMYVPPAAVQATFRQIAVLHAQNRVLFGAMAQPDSEGGFFQHLISCLLGCFGESIRWVCPQAEMPGFMLDCGLKLVTCWPYKKLQTGTGAAIPEEDENYYLAIA